ncbi:lysine decarboxylation/transport transcriptional activator CadC [Psychromonas aquimarina]|uniref:lysine decarboxylation/transport transcriptional activator CadC n=1 Tax=Psychromonas aquimarina TaxID=444919 RepID=UPI0003FE0FE8|nr:lysine decarboxylation/transport transcriptional activator CadC [Psychromonas aquimarina]
MNGLCFQISSWILIVEENKLYRQGREVTVEPRLVNLLSFLAQSPGEVFCREELIEHVWDGAIVTDQVVTQSIFELRKILKDGRVDCDRFIATVPKRGYKLVAETIPLTTSDASKLKQQAEVSASDITEEKKSADESEDDNEPTITAFPAGPLTRAVTHISNHAAAEKAKHDDQLTFYQRYKLQIFDAFLLATLIAIIFLCTYVQRKPDITKVLDTQVVEFSYHASQSSDVTSEYLADGITQELMSDVLMLGDYRVQLKKAAFTTGVLPGKVVSVIVAKQQGQSYLDINYHNNASNRLIFSRQYLISDGELYNNLRQASWDLMAALNINATELQLNNVMAKLPEEQNILTKLLIAYHYTTQTDVELFMQGITLFEEILAVEPNNGLLLAERYIAYNVLASLSPSKDFIEEVKLAGKALLANYADVGSNHLLGREYEAFALQALQKGDIQKANHFIALAGKERRSPLYYIILGKLAELRGDLDSAGDAYTQAFYIDASLETYQLCLNLAFHSNLDVIAWFMHSVVNPTSIKLK